MQKMMNLPRHIYRLLLRTALPILVGTLCSQAQTPTPTPTQWQGNSTEWRSASNWSADIPNATRTARISQTNLDPFVPAALSGDTAATYDLEILESGNLYFDSDGILIIAGTLMKIQNKGVINLGTGKIIARSAITFRNGGTFNAGDGTLEFSGLTWENQAGPTFDPGTSTVVFTGTESQTLIIDDSASFSFNNLVINTTGEMTISGALTVTGDCSLATGSSINISAGGSFTVE